MRQFSLSRVSAVKQSLQNQHCLAALDFSHVLLLPFFSLLLSTAQLKRRVIKYKNFNQAFKWSSLICPQSYVESLTSLLRLSSLISRHLFYFYSCPRPCTSPFLLNALMRDGLNLIDVPRVSAIELLVCACTHMMDGVCVVSMMVCFPTFPFTYCVSTHINQNPRSFSLSSLTLILSSSTAWNVLVLCEVSTYASRPVMWMPNYDESIQASCQTLALDGVEQVIVRKYKEPCMEYGVEMEAESSGVCACHCLVKVLVVILGKGDGRRRDMEGRG